MITKDVAGKATARALALGAMATFLVVVACETPGPMGVAAPSARALDKTAVLVAADEAPCHPAMFVNGEATTRAGLEALAPEEIETIHVLKGAVALEVNRLRLVPESGEGAATLGSPECGVILIIGKDATAAERDRVRRMLETASSERPEPEARSPEELSAAPTFTPMTVRPELLNGPEVKEALQQYYPPLLKDAGIGGTVNLWFFIDREGTVADTRVNKGSGHEALDQAALKVAERMRFTPAYDRDQRVPVWVALDVRFESEKVVDRADERANESGLEGESERQLRERLDAARERRRAEIREQAARAELDADGSVEPRFTPTRFTPMTEPPKLRNTREVSESLMALYPPLLKDAGIGGTANVWFFIDATGTVRETAINRSSGYEALDAAALKAAERMAFTPAKNGDEAVAVWVALDVTFEVQ